MIGKKMSKQEKTLSCMGAIFSGTDKFNRQGIRVSQRLPGGSLLLNEVARNMANGFVF